MARLGILTFDYLNPIGGQSTFAQGLVAHLRSHSHHEVFILAPGRSNDPQYYQLSLMPPGLSHSHPLFSASLIFSLERAIRKLRLDIIFANCGRGGVFVTRKPSVPLICYCHIPYTLERKRLSVPSKILSALEQRTYQLADLVVGNSTATIKELTCATSRTDIELLYPGVTATDFANPRTYDPFHIGFIGRLEPRKGVREFIAATSPLLQKHSNLRITIAGAGSLLKEVRAWQAREGWLDRVEVRGAIDSEDVAALFLDVGFVVVPSHMEGFGLVAAEALATATPVVATKVAGLTDVLGDPPVGGLFAQPRRVESLRRAIARLIGEESLLGDLGEAGRLRVQQNFSWDVVIPQYLKLFRRFSLH